MSRLLHLCDTPSSDVIWLRPLRVAGVYKRGNVSERVREFGELEVSERVEFGELVVSESVSYGRSSPADALPGWLRVLDILETRSTECAEPYDSSW